MSKETTFDAHLLSEWEHAKTGYNQAHVANEGRRHTVQYVEQYETET